MARRSSSTIAWSLGVGWVGALAIGAAGLALTVVVDIASSALDALGHASSDATSTSDIWVVTGASMGLCLAVAGGGGWVLAGGPDGLTPRWLAGLAVGLVGVAAGAALFAIVLGLTPI
ncbi:hypothetical protein [Pedococcus bigeumensis]|uniref:hypothetical protein n=1 Tax=Pedococcus bigeumensis TaxID=433644 RepID=UPI002FE98834